MLASKTPSVDLPGRYFTVYLSFFCGLCSIGTILCAMSHKRTGTNNTQFRYFLRVAGQCTAAFEKLIVFRLIAATK